MGILCMSEEKSKKIKELEAEFRKRIDALPEKDNHNVLDGGKTRVSIIFEWFRSECKKIDKEYPD